MPIPIYDRNDSLLLDSQDDNIYLRGTLYTQYEYTLGFNINDVLYSTLLITHVVLGHNIDDNFWCAIKATKNWMIAKNIQNNIIIPNR